MLARVLGLIGSVGSRPGRDEAGEEGSEPRSLLLGEAGKRGRHGITTPTARFREHRPTRCRELHDAAATIVRIDGAGDLTTLRGLRDEPTGPRLIDADGLGERTDAHAVRGLLPSERIEHPESRRLRDRRLTRVTSPTGRPPRTAEARTEARATPAPSTRFAHLASTVIVVIPALSVLPVMVMLRPPAPTAATETASGLITTDLHERLLDELDGVAS